MSRALKWALGPLLLAQGVWTRRRTPRLPEAEGERQGEVGRGPLLRLLVVGDSSAAGVGVERQEQALAPQLAERLALRARLAVRWQLIARSGVNTLRAVEMLDQVRPRRADLALVVLGVNDVLDQVPVSRALAARSALAEGLREHCNVGHVAFAALPPMHRFPALPRPLRDVLGADARRHDEALRDWAQDRPGVSYVPLGLSLNPAHMAADGFHPGAVGYRVCAESLAEGLLPLIPQREALA
jgi:lysophospholipase L1-like esterase